jgi:pantetheine-phosphate adenylyltransferase
MPTLLVATLDDELTTPHFLTPAVSAAAASTADSLTILLFSKSFNSEISHTGQWNQVQRLLTFVYVQATKVAQDMDNILMEVDVLLRGNDAHINEEVGLGVHLIFRILGGEQYSSEHYCLNW